VYSGEKRVFVSTNDLPANTYLLQVSMGAMVETSKVVIK